MQVGRLLKPFYYNLTLFLLSIVKQLFLTSHFLLLMGWNFTSALMISGTMMHQERILKNKVFIPYISPSQMWKFNFAKPTFDGRILPSKSTVRKCVRFNKLFNSLIFCVFLVQIFCHCATLGYSGTIFRSPTVNIHHVVVFSLNKEFRNTNPTGLN